MARPPLAVGTSGTVRVYPRHGGFQARTKVRDLDGRTRDVTRQGATKGAARRALATAISERSAGGRGDVTPDTLVADTAEMWWQEFSRGKASPNTLRLYRDRLDRQIIPALGNLHVRELTVGACDRHIQTVSERHGPGTARTTRAVLSNICGFAARHDALIRNPIRDIGEVKQHPKRRAKSLSLDEARDLSAKYHLDQQAIDRDLCDMLDFMLCTGLRVAETCAIEWDDLSLDDLENGTVRVGDAVVVRERGVGLYIRHEESNKLKERTLELPRWAVKMLRVRKERAVNSVVFPSPKGQLRDPSNTSADIKDAFTKAGYGWATSHVFRKTVASLMEENGLGARAAADQLGHSDINMTQGHYFGRTKTPTGAKRIFEQVKPSNAQTA